MPGGSKDSPKRRYPNRSTRSQHPRSSARLKVKGLREFVLPDKTEVLANLAPEGTSSKNYRHLRPRKLVNDYIKERNYYNNPDGIDLFDDDTLDDFIEDDNDTVERTKRKQKRKSSGSEWEEDSDDIEYSEGSAVSESDDVLADDAKSEISIYSESVVDEPDINVLSSDKVEESDSDVQSDSSTEEFLATRIKKSLKTLPKRVTSSTWWKTNKDPVSACKKRRRPLIRTPVVESDDDSDEEDESSPTKHKQRRRMTISDDDDDDDDDNERPSGSGIRNDSPEELLDKYSTFKSNRNVDKHISKNKIIPQKHDNDDNDLVVNQKKRRSILDLPQSNSSEDEKTPSERNIQIHNHISSSDDSNQTEDQTSYQQSNLDNGTISKKAFAASSRKRIRTNMLLSCEESESEIISQSSESKQESDLNKEKDSYLSDSEIQCPKSAKRNRKVLIEDDDDEQKQEEHISQEVPLELNTSDDQGYNVNSVQSSIDTYGKELTITDSGLMQQEKTCDVHLAPHEAVKKPKVVEIAIANDRQNIESEVTSHSVIISNNEHIEGNEFDNKDPRCSVSNPSNKSNVQTESKEVESIVEKSNNDDDTEQGNNEMDNGGDKVQTAEQQSTADEKDNVCTGTSKDSESEVSDAKRKRDRGGSNETNVGNALNELNEGNTNNKADIVISDANISIKEEEKLVLKAYDYDSDDSVIECEAPPKSPIPEITLSSDEDEDLPPSTSNASNIKVTSAGQQHIFPRQNMYNSISSDAGGFNTAFSDGRSFTGNLFGQHLSSGSFTFASNAGNNHSQANIERSVTGFGNQATNIPNFSATSQFGNRMQSSDVFNNADVRTVFSTASVNASAANLQSQNQAEIRFRSWGQVSPEAHNYQSANRLQTIGGNAQYQSFTNAQTMNRFSMSGISSDNITNNSNVRELNRLPCESTQYQSFTGPGNQNRAQSTNLNIGPEFQYSFNQSPVLGCQTGENVTVPNCQDRSRFKENYALLRNLLKTDTTLNRQPMSISGNNGMHAQQFQTPNRLQTSVPTGTAAATSAANFRAVNNSCQRTGNYVQRSSFTSADHVVPTTNRINVIHNYQANSYGMSANNIHQPSIQSSAHVGGIITGSNGRVLNYQAENRPEAQDNNIPFQSMSSISNNVSVVGTHPYSSSHLFSTRTPILNNYQTQTILNRRSPTSTDTVESVVNSQSQIVNQFQRPDNVQIQTRPNASSLSPVIGDSSNFQSVNRFSVPGNSVQPQTASAILPPSTGMVGSAKNSQSAVNRFHMSNNSLQPQSLLNATVVGASNSALNQSLNRLEMFTNHIHPETPSEVQVSTADRVQPQTIPIMGTTSTGMLVSAQSPQSLNIFQMSGNSIVQPQTIPSMLPTSTGMLSSSQISQSVKRFQNAGGSAQTQTLPAMGLTPTGVVGSAQSPRTFHPQTISAMGPASSDMLGSALNSQSVNKLQMVDNSVQPQTLTGMSCTSTGNMGSIKNYQSVNRLQTSSNSIQPLSFQNTTMAGSVDSDSKHQVLNRLEMFTKNIRPQTESEVQMGTITGASNNTSLNRFTPSLPDSILCQNVETAIPGGPFASALNSLAQNIFPTSVGSSGQKQNIPKSTLDSPVASGEMDRFIENGNNEQQQTEPIVMPLDFEAYPPVKNLETHNHSGQLRPLLSAPPGSNDSYASEAIAITPILNSTSCHDSFIQQDISSVTIGNQSYAHASGVPEEATNTIDGVSHFTLGSNSSTVNPEISPELKQTKHVPRSFKPDDSVDYLSGRNCFSRDPYIVNDIETGVSVISQPIKKPVVILCDILSRIKSVKFDEARGTPREGTRNIRMNVKPGEKFLIKENNDNNEHDIIALNMNTSTVIENVKECLNSVETCRSKSQTRHDGIRDGDTTHSMVMATSYDIENSKNSFNSSQLSTSITDSCSPEQVNGHLEFVTDQPTRKAREEDRNVYKHSSRETSNDTISYRADRFNRILRSRSNSPIASDNNNERNSSLPKSRLGSSNQKNKGLEVLPVL